MFLKFCVKRSWKVNGAVHQQELFVTTYHAWLSGLVSDVTYKYLMKVYVVHFIEYWKRSITVKYSKQVYLFKNVKWRFKWFIVWFQALCLFVTVNNATPKHINFFLLINKLIPSAGAGAYAQMFWGLYLLCFWSQNPSQQFKTVSRHLWARERQALSFIGVSSIFPQVYVPPALYSPSSMFSQLCSPMV